MADTAQLSLGLPDDQADEWIESLLAEWTATDLIAIRGGTGPAPAPEVTP